MNNTVMATRKRSGSALIVVMGLTVLAAMAAASMAISVSSRVRQADKMVCMEQAFYLASTGAERAASHVAAGNDSSITLTGTHGSGSYVVVIDVVPQSGGEYYYNVSSRGTVKGVSRNVVLRGLRRVSWARYALWYDSEASKLWIVPGEKFDGRVYSRPQLHFHNQDLSTKGQVIFEDRVWSAASSIEKASSSVNPVFKNSLVLNAPLETMASVDFNDFLAKATASGLVLEGESTIVVDNTTLKITNSRKGWSNKSVSIPANGTVYVKTVTSGTAPRTGNITFSAPNGLGSRLTVVADNDINIVGHVRYKRNPNPSVTPNYPDSTDALGLIAKRSVVVQLAAPDNLDVYAHIMCQTGGFGVYKYNEGDSRGKLTVYGGIVNSVRNAVGTTSGTGYLKNYIFDKRFSKNPPPNYPVLTDELEWIEWDG